MKIQGALFDLDGTLLQSMEMWQQLPLQLVRRLGGEPPEDLARTIEAMDQRQAAEYIIRTFGFSVSVDVYKRQVLYTGGNRRWRPLYRRHLRDRNRFVFRELLCVRYTGRAGTHRLHGQSRANDF